MANEKKRILPVNAGIEAGYSVVGNKERQGPLGGYFDEYDQTESDKFGQPTWEKAESEMQRLAFSGVMKKAGRNEGEIGALFAGDLLNQCVSSAYGLLSFDIPYFGLYGACSTAAEGLMLASLMVSHDICALCGAVTSSHNAAAERQYRTPLEYGGQRTPTAQWTVTGAGAFLVSKMGNVRICEVMPGIVIDKGISDANNMGAAMAPAAADTIAAYFRESGHRAQDFDLIATGDLGWEGNRILSELLAGEGVILPESILNDCGMMMFNRTEQDTHAGGSGCGCSAVVLASYLLPRLASGEWHDVLLIGTGAMMSPSSVKQGLSIPAVGHLLHLTREADA